MSDLTPAQEERLGRYRAGRMDEAERAAFEREVAASDALAEELFAETVLDDLRAERPRAVRAPRRLPARPSPWQYALPIAAALLVVSAVTWWSRRPPAPEEAGGMRGGTEVSRLIEPSGALAGPPAVFRWNAAPRAERYRVELYDADGLLIGTAVTRDTVVAVAGLTDDAPAAGEWRVVPIFASGLDGRPLGRETYRVVPPR